MTRQPVPIEAQDETTSQTPPERSDAVNVDGSQHTPATPETTTTDQPPAPAISLLPGGKRREPDAAFIRDITTAIRAGVRPMTAAAWLGVGKKQWKLWRSRSGGVYDELRTAVASATAHLEVKLMADLAKRSPGAALKGLRRVRDDDPEPPARMYHQHGLHTVKRALPFLVERVCDATVPTTDLSPLEVAARQWRDDVLADLGDVSAARRALLDAAVGSKILMSSLDSYIFQLASGDGLVSKRHRRAFPILEQRMRVADSLARQLQTLGLDKAKPGPQALNEFLAKNYPDTPQAEPAREGEHA